MISVISRNHHNYNSDSSDTRSYQSATSSIDCSMNHMGHSTGKAVVEGMQCTETVGTVHTGCKEVVGCFDKQSSAPSLMLDSGRIGKKHLDNVPVGVEEKFVDG